MCKNVCLVSLLAITCPQVLSAPAEQLLVPANTVSVEPNAHAMPPSAITACLAALLAPVFIQYALDLVGRLSEARPGNVSLPKAQIAMLITHYYTSYAIGMLLVVYGIVHKHLESGATGIGVLVALFTSNLSHSSTSRLRTILSKLPHKGSFPSTHNSLLSYAVRELTRLATSSGHWTTLPFDEFLDLIVLCLHLGDAELLERLMVKSSSWCVASKLREIRRHTSDFKALHDAGNNLVSPTFRALVCNAMQPVNSGYLKFSSRVDLVAYGLKLENEQLVNTFLLPSAGQSHSCANKLHELQARLPDSDSLPETGRRYLPAALRDLVQMAVDENSPIMVPFGAQVQLVISYLQTVRLNWLTDHPKWGTASDMPKVDQERVMAVYSGVEGVWLRAWLHRFHGSTFGQDENQIIWQAAVQYSRT